MGSTGKSCALEALFGAACKEQNKHEQKNCENNVEQNAAERLGL